jgi:hypothetical protein
VLAGRPSRAGPDHLQRARCRGEIARPRPQHLGAFKNVTRLADAIVKMADDAAFRALAKATSADGADLGGLPRPTHPLLPRSARPSSSRSMSQTALLAGSYALSRVDRAAEAHGHSRPGRCRGRKRSRLECDICVNLRQTSSVPHPRPLHHTQGEVKRPGGYWRGLLPAQRRRSLDSRTAESATAARTLIPQVISWPR